MIKKVETVDLVAPHRKEEVSVLGLLNPFKKSKMCLMSQASETIQVGVQDTQEREKQRKLLESIGIKWSLEAGRLMRLFYVQAVRRTESLCLASGQ